MGLMEYHSFRPEKVDVLAEQKPRIDWLSDCTCLELEWLADSLLIIGLVLLVRNKGVAPAQFETRG